MKTKKRKKLLLSVAAVVLTAALGAGIWFGTRGGGEPVNVYPFQYIGMTEFWGDAQESYGPVTTDKIQTEFLTDTQTVTEVKVKDGDMVKKGDVLFTFDTTLDALSLERKRLEVEKIKVQIDAAGERLQDTREMVPYEPPEVTEPEEADLGKELAETYEISEEIGKDKKEYDGISKETALICWMKDGTPISDAILEQLFKRAADYQKTTLTKPDTEEDKAPESSASETPTGENLTNNASEDLEIPQITIYPYFSGKKLQENVIEEKLISVDDKEIPAYIVPDVWKYTDDDKQEKTCWLLTAKRRSDGKVLTDLVIDGFPRGDADEKQEWLDLWGEGIEVQYTRDVSVEGKIAKNNELIPLNPENSVELEVGHQAVLIITSQMKNLEKQVKLEYSFSQEKPIFETVREGNQYFLIGKPEQLIDSAECTVTATYSFDDNNGKNWEVKEAFTFVVKVVKEPRTKTGEFYVVFKSTQDNYLKGTLTLWQGAKVTAYDNDTFDMQLYNPYEVAGFTDHTIEPEPEIEVDLPEIDPNEMYTAEQILDMQKQCYAIIKEQNEKLKLAEAEYNVMQRELGDGNIYAEIDGKVVSLLTEEEAKDQKQPLLKVSGGGGFYIEGSVSELEREKLKIGQEVTVNDWQSGGMYTGEVVSVGDFPTDDDNWNGMGNPTVSYYPFKAFVGEEADLQAGSYVSMSYSTASAEQGIYLEKAFVRTEQGKSYIYIRGTDGRLEKRDVKVGKVLWGSYYEILSPLGEEDYLAFPYGKNVKAGAPTVESDLNALYGY